MNCYHRSDQTCLRGDECAQCLRDVAQRLIRVCNDEANRLANHCHDSEAEWAMKNLYTAAADAQMQLK